MNTNTNIKGLKHLNHSVGQNCFHLVWKVKWSLRLLANVQLRKTTEGMIRFLAIQKGWTIYELNVQPDHIHLFIDFPPSVSISYVLAFLKAKTAGMLFRNFPGLKSIFPKKHFWSSGKFFRSVGNVTADVIKNYIRYSQGEWKTVFPQRHAYYNQQRLTTYIQ